ncbi:unnamed protein product [Penicillium salamii]|nr:unnamed protein product [Penicillium salamii]CAG7964254.1 unnamed protein product [Penicillium salamii]CAG8277575.1 unnamed protein product [Penicillium salamii]
MAPFQRMGRTAIAEALLGDSALEPRIRLSNALHLFEGVLIQIKAITAARRHAEDTNNRFPRSEHQLQRQTYVNASVRLHIGILYLERCDLGQAAFQDAYNDIILDLKDIVEDQDFVERSWHRAAWLDCIALSEEISCALGPSPILTTEFLVRPVSSDITDTQSNTTNQQTTNRDVAQLLCEHAATGDATAGLELSEKTFVTAECLARGVTEYSFVVWLYGWLFDSIKQNEMALREHARLLTEFEAALSKQSIGRIMGLARDPIAINHNTKYDFPIYASNRFRGSSIADALLTAQESPSRNREELMVILKETIRSARYLPKFWELEVDSLSPQFQRIVERRVNARNNEETVQARLGQMLKSELLQREHQLVREIWAFAASRQEMPRPPRDDALDAWPNVQDGEAVRMRLAHLRTVKRGLIGRLQATQDGHSSVSSVGGSDQARTELEEVCLELNFYEVHLCGRF